MVRSLELLPRSIRCEVFWSSPESSEVNATPRIGRGERCSIIKQYKLI
jgi:hypothetical protein